MGDCRGKALVLSRLREPDVNHYDTRKWPDNPRKKQIGPVGHPRRRVQADVRYLVIQDLYKSPEVDEKKDAVDALVGDAKGAPTEFNLYLNFTSFVWKPWEPVWSGSTHMTPHLTGKTEGAGVICVDAVTEALATHIINWNWVSNTDWMSMVKDDICITRLSIPGTHDSGAYQSTVKPMTRAQTLSISQQLAAGVRALDIRCAATYGSEGTWSGFAMDVLGGPTRRDIQFFTDEKRTTYNVL